MSISLAWEAVQYVRISVDMCMNNYSRSVVDMVFVLALASAMRVRIYRGRNVDKSGHTMGHVGLRCSLLLRFSIVADAAA